MAFTNGKKPLLDTVSGFVKLKWKRILIWLLAALVCGYGCAQVQHLSRYNLPWRTTKEFPHAGRWNPHPSIPGTVELGPGESAEQSFTAMGNIVGSCAKVYLELPAEEQTGAELSVQLWWEREESAPLAEAETEITEVPEDGMAELTFPREVMIKSAEQYRLVVTNTSSTETLLLGVDHSIQSGELRQGQEKIDGALTYGFQRTAMYTPSGLVPLLSLLTCLTLLTGLALALFTNVKTHVLYFILAVGFGIVTLFDLTPLYGFDMRFQFDSAYVVSNELLGLEGEIKMPSRADPGKLTSGYYRRACDDYSMFQFYKEEYVSDNYTDMAAGLRHLRAKGEQKDLILVETNQGYISDQLYIMYLPQAIGFAIARLLGLGFLPMVQFGRIVPYMLFVLLMCSAIRSVPFGKRMFMILALLPSVMAETVSINRDGVVFGLSFFLTAKVLQAAYGDREPTVWNWLVIWIVSALLAPCKAIYLPISFFWLLPVYRRYVYRQSNWKKALLWVVCGLIPIILVMVFTSSMSPLRISRAEVITPTVAAVKAAAPAAQTAAVEAPQLYTFGYIFSNLPRVCTVLWNTLRVELGTYLINAIQLFDIEVGSSDALTVLILFLLLIECCHDDPARQPLRQGDRYFSLLVVIGVFGAMMLAALRWTEIGSYTIFGTQGRYFTPVLPLLGVFLMNNRWVKFKGSPALLVNVGCCIFPAIYLMNMYLWTISR